MPSYAKGPFHFGRKSLAVRSELHPDLQRLWDAVIQRRDVSLIDGQRTWDEQVENVKRGVSKTMNTRHFPRDPVTGERRDDGGGVAWASDALPYPFVGWGKKGAESDLLIFGGYVLAIAEELGLDIRYGGDWNSDWMNSDNGFNDLDHFEKRLPPGVV